MGRPAEHGLHPSRLARGVLGDGWLGRLAESAEPWLLERLGLVSRSSVEQIHLSWGADAAREITVSWRTAHPASTPFVEVDGVRVAARSIRTAGTTSWSHHATIGPLDPASTVTYAVGDHGRVRSRPGTAHTAPAGPAPFEFTAFGDHGTDRPAPDVPPTHDAKRTVDLVEHLEPCFHLVAGDLSYANGDPLVWDRWLRMIEPSARHRPWVPCVGNHEVERSTAEGGFARPSQARGGLGYAAFTDRFRLPGHGLDGEAPTFGTFRYAGVRFVMLDNNDVCAEFAVNRGHTGGRQRAWLEHTLAHAARDPSIELVVVVMHHPAFSSARGHGSDLGVRAAWHGLFVEHGVDLVLQGHDHLYERTHPLGGSAEDPEVGVEGVTYVTCGNGGFAQPGAASGPAPAWSAVRDDRHAGVVRVAVTPAGANSPAQLALTHHPVSAPDAPTDAVTLTGRRTPVPGQVAAATVPARALKRSQRTAWNASA